MTSGYYPDCSKAVRNIVPKVNINAVHEIIQNTPVISDERKTFYQTMIEMRKHFLLDAAFECAANHNYNQAALQRIEEGKPYSKDTFQKDWNSHKYDNHISYICEKLNLKND